MKHCELLRERKREHGLLVVKHPARLRESYPEVLEAVPEQHRGQIKANPEVHSKETGLCLLRAQVSASGFMC